MRWRLKHGNLLDEPAEALVVSANPFLTLSGGVGGALLNRYGQAIQDELRYYLRSRGKRHAEPCDVVPTYAGGTPYKVVLHAVAIDAFYDTSPEWIATALERSLCLAAEHGARSVACAALATGYAQLPLEAFALGLKPVLRQSFAPIDEAVLCLGNRDKFARLAELLPELCAAATQDGAIE